MLGALVLGLNSCSRGSKSEVGGPVQVSAAEADTLLRYYAKDRADTEEWLKSSPTSYLATIERKDFENRSTLTVGSGPGVDVLLSDPGIRPRHVQVIVVGDSFRVETLDPKARFQVKDSTMSAGMLPPGQMKVGRYTLRLSHQRYPAIIVFDPNSPRFREYKGMKFYPADLGYRVVAPLTPNPNPDTTIILSTRGSRRRAVRVGWFDFKVKGSTARLEADRLLEPGVGEKDISLFFQDATTGKESYSVGRYLNPELQSDGRYILDFNMAYDPACAYSEHYNCPIPPKENRLSVAIRAGQMDAHYLH